MLATRPATQDSLRRGARRPALGGGWLARLGPLGLVVLALAGSAGLVAGCGAPPPAAPAKPDAAPYDRATEVVFHSGRGTPGWRFGYTLHRDGAGVDWETRPEGNGARQESAPYTARSADVDALLRAFQDSGFVDQRLASDDPWGSTLELVWPEGRHSVSWASATHPPGLAPILKAFARLRAHRTLR